MDIDREGDEAVNRLIREGVIEPVAGNPCGRVGRGFGVTIDYRGRRTITVHDSW